MVVSTGPARAFEIVDPCGKLRSRDVSNQTLTECLGEPVAQPAAQIEDVAVKPFSIPTTSSPAARCKCPKPNRKFSPTSSGTKIRASGLPWRKWSGNSVGVPTAGIRLPSAPSLAGCFEWEKSNSARRNSSMNDETELLLPDEEWSRPFQGTGFTMAAPAKAPGDRGRLRLRPSTHARRACLLRTSRDSFSAGS